MRALSTRPTWLLTLYLAHNDVFWAQGLGQAPMESRRYDPDGGQLLAASFMDYAMPREPSNPLGINPGSEGGEAAGDRQKPNRISGSQVAIAG